MSLIIDHPTMDGSGYILTPSPENGNLAGRFVSKAEYDALNAEAKKVKPVLNPPVEKPIEPVKPKLEMKPETKAAIDKLKQKGRPKKVK